MRNESAHDATERKLFFAFNLTSENDSVLYVPVPPESYFTLTLLYFHRFRMRVRSQCYLAVTPSRWRTLDQQTWQI